MTETRFVREQVELFLADVLRDLGTPAPDAWTTARRITDADARGVKSHGVMRFPSYVQRIRAGGYNLTPRIREVRSGPVSALLDGDNGLGQVVMTRAAELAIEKAERSGIGWIGVRGSNHAGAGGVYASMALEHRWIGIYMAIGNANHLPPWGGVDPLMSTNPIAFAIPAGDEPDLVFDMATTAVSYGRIKLAAQNGESMPVGWMVDRAGHPLTDPTRSHDGVLLPTGGYKGYGLGLVIGALAGVLNEAAIGSSTTDFNSDFTSATNTGHAMIVVRPDLFSEPTEFEARMDSWLSELRSSTVMTGVDRIRVPGDRIPERILDADSFGLSIPQATLDALGRLSDELGIPFPEPRQ